MAARTSSSEIPGGSLRTITLLRESGGGMLSHNALTAHQNTSRLSDHCVESRAHFKSHHLGPKGS